MKLQYTSGNGRFRLEFEGDSQKALFEQVAKFQEIFEQNTCGKCGGSDVHFNVRSAEDNKYFELRCQNKKCGYQFAYGQNKKGDTLFPKYFNEAAEAGTRGWFKWVPPTDDASPPKKEGSKF